MWVMDKKNFYLIKQFFFILWFYIIFIYIILICFKS